MKTHGDTKKHYHEKSEGTPMPPPPQGLIKGLLTIIVPYQSPNQAGYFGGGLGTLRFP